MATMQPDPLAIQDEAQGAPEETGGYDITIYVRPDGQFEISKEAHEDAAMEAQEGEAGEETDEQLAPDIKSAMRAVLTIYKSNTQTTEADAAASAFGSARADGRM